MMIKIVYVKKNLKISNMIIKLPQIIFMMITAILYIAKGTMKDMKITRMMQMEILYRRRETMVQELSGNMKII